MKPRPARLEPQFVPRIWGARDLSSFFPEMHSLAEPVGEVWLTGNDCRFADGPFAGEKLGDAWPRMPEEWIGRARNETERRRPFPLLVKFLFPQDKLSVQVHPDDEFAQSNEAAMGGVGKTEMWYVISARPGAEVRVGLKPEVTREQFRRAIADGTAEDCIERVPVRAGDAVFVPAGTVHTIGPGMVLCEIQENSDITYRVFDYGRRGADGKPRELHIEKALQVVRFGEQHGGKVKPVASSESNSGLQSSLIVDCPYFRVEKSSIRGRQSWTRSSRNFDLIIVLDGCGQFEIAGDHLAYAQMQPWLMPAALPDLTFVPETPTTILRTFVPDKSHR